MNPSRQTGLSPSRRDFLRVAGATAASLPLASPLLARGLVAPKSPTLVVVYLRGGADWLNMVIPWKDDDYSSVRPTIRIGEDDGIIPLDGTFGLHPALAPLKSLYEKKKFAPVLCTGSPHGTRSHFDAQDFMERAAPGRKDIRSGWLNRYLESTDSSGSSVFRALSVQELLPRSLRGDYPALAVSPKVDSRRGRTALDRFDEFYDGGMEAMDMRKGSDNDEQVVQSGRSTIDALRRYTEIISADKGRRVDYPKSRFGGQLSTIATIVRARCGMEVAAVDYGGWDHHINQGSTEGNHNRMLADLAASLSSFSRDLGDQLDETLVVVMTEFGRTVRENGNNGTDHGRGSGMFLLGGGVLGGRIHGDWRGLKSADLADGRDLPVTTDFRDVMSSALDGVFDFDARKDFFPDYKPSRIKLF